MSASARLGCCCSFSAAATRSAESARRRGFLLLRRGCGASLALLASAAASYSFRSFSFSAASRSAESARRRGFLLLLRRGCGASLASVVGSVGTTGGASAFSLRRFFFDSVVFSEGAIVFFAGVFSTILASSTTFDVWRYCLGGNRPKY